MNPQRILKSLPSIRPKSLVPFSTPLADVASPYPRVSARLLFPSNYNIKSSQFMGSARFSKTPSTTLDLRALSDSVSAVNNHVHCDVAGGYLFLNSFSANKVYCGTAVVFPDGTLVTWFMDKNEETNLTKRILDTHRQCDPLASSRSKRAEAAVVDQFLGSDLCESIGVSDGSDEEPKSLLIDGGDSLALTSNTMDRSNDMLAISMALASAVRMNLIESYLQDHISSGHTEISKLLQRMNNWKLSKVSETIFQSEQLVHNWRYFLTQNGVDDVPDCLWDYGELDKLYEQVMKSFDVPKRFNDINTDLTYYSEFLATCGEHVRHKYSSRLERIIIAIIAIEAGIALRHLLIDLLGKNGDDSTVIVPVNSDTNLDP